MPIEQLGNDTYAGTQTSGLPGADNADLVAFVSDIESLDVIKRDTCQLAVWRRPRVPQLHRELANLGIDDLPDSRLVVSYDGIPNAIASAASKVPHAATRKALIDDVILLAQRFSRLVDAQAVHIRFDATERQTCPKFHRDYVRARLICTYRGPGTDWGVANTKATASMLADAGQLSPFDVAVFKGELWRPASKAPQRTIVHRSPALGDTTQPRLAVIIDPAQAGAIARH